MHYRLLTLIVIFILAETGFLSAQENYAVRKVIFTGNHTLKKDFLLEKMALDEVTRAEQFFSKKEPFLFNRELMDLDLERLKKIYQSEGFLNAGVRLDYLEENHKKQTVSITLAVQEGLPVITDSISLYIAGSHTAIDPDSLLRELSDDLKLKPGQRFRDADLEEDLKYVENALKDLGYAYSSADYNLNLKLNQQKTGIQFQVKPGPLTRLGETVISGNRHVPEAFIRKQLMYESGDRYNQSLLDKTRQQLYYLQRFRVVSVLPERDIKTQKNPIPVNIYVEEASRLSTRFGAGYGTEDRFRTFLDVNLRGLTGGARRLNLYLKHSALEPYLVRLKFIQPLFPGTRSTLAVNPFIVRNSEPGYDTRTYGVNIPFSYAFTTTITGNMTYYLENVRQYIEAGDPEFTNMESDQFLYNKSGILLSAVYNTSSPAFSPVKGVNLSLGFKINGHLFGGDFSYTRLWGDLRAYQQAGDAVLAFRLMAGGINTPAQSGFIPVEDRFYSGGSNSIRGWNRSELGPKRESGTPLGGKSIFESNVEVRYPLFWRLSLAAFFEAGNVWEASRSWQIDQLGYAAGSGIRIDTPVGPVRFDLGFPLWNEKKSPQFFISVGQAF